MPYHRGCRSRGSSATALPRALARWWWRWWSASRSGTAAAAAAWWGRAPHRQRQKQQSTLSSGSRLRGSWLLGSWLLREPVVCEHATAVVHAVRGQQQREDAGSAYVTHKLQEQLAVVSAASRHDVTPRQGWGRECVGRATQHGAGPDRQRASVTWRPAPSNEKIGPSCSCDVTPQPGRPTNIGP